MNNTMRKLLALLLVFCLTAVYVPMAVQAAGDGDVQVTQEEPETEPAEPTLDEIKAAAKLELKNYKNAGDYRTAQQTELANAIRDGEAAIDAAEDADAVAAAVAAAKAVIDTIKTRAELTAIDNQAAANEVIALINAIGTVDDSWDCEKRIRAAREAYDNLNGAQKALVTNKDKLEQAEAAFSALQDKPCKYCGEIHDSSLGGGFKAILHSVLYFLLHLIGKR